MFLTESTVLFHSFLIEYMVRVIPPTHDLTQLMLTMIFSTCQVLHGSSILRGLNLNGLLATEVFLLYPLRATGVVASNGRLVSFQTTGG